MRFTHIDFNFDITYEGHQNWSKYFPWKCCGFLWPSYVIKKMDVNKCQMSKNQTPRLWRRFTKEINWHNEVHRYWHQFWHHTWCSLKTLKMSIGSIFEQFWWCWNWCQYLWTSLLQLIFFVNLLYSSDVWIFDIWHLFDNLTSF